MPEGDLSLTERIWASHGLFMGEVKPCSCDQKRIFAVPEIDKRGMARIRCMNCGTWTGWSRTPERALENWNRK